MRMLDQFSPRSSDIAATMSSMFLELERTGKTDAEQLEYAINQQRAILTHNIRDFIILDRQYRNNGREHFGILLSDQVTLSELLGRTLPCLGPLCRGRR